MRMLTRNKTRFAGFLGETGEARRTMALSVLALLLLLMQYPLAELGLPLWKWVGLFLLLHCVVLLVDSLCASCFESAAAQRSGRLLHCLLPTQPRGISQLFTLLAMLGTMLVAAQVHELAAPATAPQD